MFKSELTKGLVSATLVPMLLLMTGFLTGCGGGGGGGASGSASAHAGNGGSTSYNPAVSGISPTTISSSGGLLTITGTNLSAGSLTSITVAGSACTGATVVSATQATCTAPAHAAGLTAVVYNDSTSGALAAGNLTYSAAAPTITSVSPTSISTEGGATFTVNGTNFVSGTFQSITIGGVTCTSPTYVNSTQYTCTTPAGTAGSQTVTYTDSSTGSANSTVTYVQAGRILSSSVLATFGHLQYRAGQTQSTPYGSRFLSAAQGTNYLIGASPDGYNGAGQIVRITSAGAVDGGFTAINQSGIQAIAVAQSSKIYVASMTQPAGCSGTVSGVTVKRYGINGASDGTFTFGGLPALPTTTQFNGTMSGCWSARVMPFQASDAFYLLLEQSSSRMGNVCIAEYQATGSTLTTFGQSGVICVHSGPAATWTTSTYVQDISPYGTGIVSSAKQFMGLTTMDFLNVDASGNLYFGMYREANAINSSYVTDEYQVVTGKLTQANGTLSMTTGTIYNNGVAYTGGTEYSNSNYSNGFLSMTYLGYDSTNNQFLVQAVGNDTNIYRFNLSAVRDGAFSIAMGATVTPTGNEGSYQQAYLQSGGGYLLLNLQGAYGSGWTLNTVLTNSSGALLTGFTSAVASPDSNLQDFAIYGSDSTNQFTANMFTLGDTVGGNFDQLVQTVWDKQ